jgi:copper chaperone CopZ
VYSDAIVTGEGSKSAAGLNLDWDKIESTLKRVEGVTSVSLDAASRRINLTFVGPWTGIEKVRNAAQTAGASAELVSPAKVTFRPTVQVDDDAKITAALKGVSGVHHVAKDFNDYVLYADLATLDLDEISKAVLGVGVKGLIATHEWVRVGLGSTAGNSSQLLDELAKTKWVLRAEIDAATSSVKVLAVKGRVTRALVKSVLAKCGYTESK